MRSNAGENAVRAPTEGTVRDLVGRPFRIAIDRDQSATQVKVIAKPAPLRHRYRLGEPFRSALLGPGLRSLIRPEKTEGLALARKGPKARPSRAHAMGKKLRLNVTKSRLVRAVVDYLAMDCPKCGASNPDAREDCASCGVYFSKMRRTTLNQPRPAPAALPTAVRNTGLPFWQVGAIVILILVIGVAWLRYRRVHPAESNIDAQMTEINRRMAKEEMARATEDANRALEARQTLSPRSLPEELTQDAVIAEIEACSSFQPRKVISLGKVQGTDPIVHVTFKWTAPDVDRPQTGEVQFHLRDGTWKRGQVWFVVAGRIKHANCP
jgi:hypothetical protein